MVPDFKNTETEKNRRIFFKTKIDQVNKTICLAAVTAAFASCSGTVEEKPNVIIILADDMGWGDVNANGNELVSTPVLNRLKSESLSFDRFYVCPLSAPTRAEMLTGRYFLRTGVSSVTRGFENMRTTEITVAEVLKDNGYTTGCFGKWHNGRYYLQHPNRQGFDEFVGFPVGHLGYYFDAFFLHNDVEKRSEGYTSDYFTAQALDFIERNRDSQFFCYVPYNVPHSPFQLPEEYFAKYNSAGLDSTLSSVYGMVENMDYNIGKILQKLKDLDLEDKTIVVFLSDNGPNTTRYNGGMKGRKGSVDEGGVRVPFYIRWPGHIEAGTTDQLAQDIDIMPTLIEMCGLKYEPVNPFDGIGLWDVIRGREEPFDRLIFSRQGNQNLAYCNSSVRNNSHRLVLTRKDTLLFNLIDDPGQKKEISGSEKETTLSLLGELVKHNRELISGYKPVTTIEAGFPGETSFTLPVQDAALSGMVKYSSIHPNQSHTENWIREGDSVSWSLRIHTGGTYKAELQYGCPEDQTGSSFILRSGAYETNFTISEAFDSQVLPERDYVKRSESVERTWAWMEAGDLFLSEGDQRISLILKEIQNKEAGLIKAIKLTQVNPSIEPPYPQSELISGINIDWSTHRRHAQGSDNFQLTWADDDHQYGIWGDGDGFSGTSGKHRVSLGVVRIEGDHNNYRGFDRYGHKESSEHEAVIRGKSWGMICVKGKLYAWIHPDKPGGWGNWEFHHKEARLHKSEDKGASWQPAEWAFTIDDGLAGGNILQFGKDYSGARDRYVYHYLSDPEILRDAKGNATELMVPGRIFLLRVHRDRMMERQAYEFFAGMKKGKPVWTGDIKLKKPVFTDSNGVGTPVGISYYAALKRYILTTQHTRPHAGMLGIFEAKEPWGPWSTITYLNEDSWFGYDNSETVPRNCFFWCFPVKWISDDGRSATMVFTGGGRGKNNDSFNTVRIEFLHQDH